MADRKSPASPAVQVEPTFRQIIDRSSRFASCWLTALDDGIDWPGAVPDDEATVLRKQVTAYKGILEMGFQAAHGLLSLLLVRPVHVRLDYLSDDSPDRMETACGVFSAGHLLRQYREDEAIDANPVEVARDVANLLDVQRALRSLRELVGAPNSKLHSHRGESAPLPEWPSGQIVTLGHWVESSWALAIQTMISRLTEAVLPRADLMDAAPTVKWMAGAAKNLRSIVPPYNEWEARHLEPTDIAKRSLAIECERWLAHQTRPPEDDDYGLPMSRDEVARRYFGDPSARYRKIEDYPALTRRIREVPGKPNKVQFYLRGLGLDMRARFIITDWQSLLPPSLKSR